MSADLTPAKKGALLRLIRLKTSIAKLHLDAFKDAVNDLSKEIEEASRTLNLGGTRKEKQTAQEQVVKTDDTADAEAGDDSILELRRDAENLAGEVAALGTKLRLEPAGALTNDPWAKNAGNENPEAESANTAPTESNKGEEANALTDDRWAKDVKAEDVEAKNQDDNGTENAKTVDAATQLSAKEAPTKTKDLILLPDAETGYPVLKPFTLNVHSSTVNPIPWTNLHKLLAIRTQILPHTKNHTLPEAEAALNIVWREQLAIKTELLRVYPTDPTAENAAIPLEKAKSRGVVSFMMASGKAVSRMIGEENLEDVSRVLCDLGMLEDMRAEEAMTRMQQTVSHDLRMRDEEEAEREGEAEQVKGPKKKRARRGKKGKGKAELGGEDGGVEEGRLEEGGRGEEGAGGPVSFDVGSAGGMVVLADLSKPGDILNILKERFGH